ncbi:MAG: DivIVA domain-containing protein [candidate division KSB1 bacterium]|nr:DivIVA domain-containing protein [candidate division KSB1 bacterium]
MKLTPLELRKHDFKRVMRGYDQEEVDAFLTMIADEFEVMIREKNQMNDELIKLRTQLRDYKQVETSLRDTLVKAQSTMEDSRENSRREAEIIMHEAELKAENIIKDAREELFSIRHEISLLKSQRDAINKRLRHMLESQLDMLDVMESESVGSRKPQRPAQQNAESSQYQSRRALHPRPDSETSERDRNPG